MQNESYMRAREERNRSIWHANRVEGVGTAKLARLHGLSRQRVKQIIARQSLVRGENRGAVVSTPPEGEMRGHV